MKKTITFIVFLFNIILVYAQRTVSLETMVECTNRADYDDNGCPDLDNVTYVKDINNKLNQFEGSWKSEFQGNSYEITFIKKEKIGKNNILWDRLVGGLIIKNSTGSIIYNDMNYINTSDPSFYGFNFQKPNLGFYDLGFYFKNDKCVKNGIISIGKKSYDKLILSFWYQEDLIIEGQNECNNKKSIFPKDHEQPLIFTKI